MKCIVFKNTIYTDREMKVFEYTSLKPFSINQLLWKRICTIKERSMTKKPNFIEEFFIWKSCFLLSVFSGNIFLQFLQELFIKVVYKMMKKSQPCTQNVINSVREVVELKK
jgi:hypothetical protein